MTLTTAQLDRAVGVLLGAAAGDALGAAYEFGPPRGPELEVAMVGAGASAGSQANGLTTRRWPSPSPRWWPRGRGVAHHGQRRVSAASSALCEIPPARPTRHPQHHQVGGRGTVLGRRSSGYVEDPLALDAPAGDDAELVDAELVEENRLPTSSDDSRAVMVLRLTQRAGLVLPIQTIHKKTITAGRRTRDHPGRPMKSRSRRTTAVHG